MGINKRGSGRDTIAPQKFLLDLGKAYRETKRQLPIMDAFAFHPYLEHANLPPTYKHYSPRVITIADYGRLVSLLGRAFDGTAQEGSKLPIVYAEFGVESRIPDALLAAYTGTEPATTRPVNESVQARFYAKAMQMAACQPTVRTFLVFRLIDERDPRRLAIGRLLRERVTEGEPAGRRGGGAPPGGAAADRRARRCWRRSRWSRSSRSAARPRASRP